jgi:hypothetical protein
MADVPEDRPTFEAPILTVMGSPAHAPDQYKEGGLRTALHLGSSGALEVMRITKAIPTGSDDLLFLGVPVRHGSSARSLRVSFAQDGTMPAPRMDQNNGRIHLHYPHRDHPEVQALLNSKRDRFCYFWRSANGDQTHAWLLSSK